MNQFRGMIELPFILRSNGQQSFAKIGFINIQNKEPLKCLSGILNWAIELWRYEFSLKYNVAN